jgi:hypothetical protein
MDIIIICQSSDFFSSNFIDFFLLFFVMFVNLFLLFFFFFSLFEFQFSIEQQQEIKHALLALIYFMHISSLYVCIRYCNCGLCIQNRNAKYIYLKNKHFVFFSLSIKFFNCPSLNMNKNSDLSIKINL